MRYPLLAITHLAGVQVVETPRLAEEVAYYFREDQTVICGSASHFRYRLAIAQFRRDVFADLERQLDAFAERVGVDRITPTE